MNKKKISLVHIIRRITQILAFLLMPGLFTSTFYAIKTIYISIIQGQFVLAEQSSQILVLLITIPLTIIMGRFFCGFFCSFGAMGDLLWFISKKTIKSKFKIGEKADAVLKYIKYGFLLFIIIGIWTFDIVPLGSTSSPWTVFGMLTAGFNLSSFQYLLSVGGLLLLLIMIGSLFVERFFCRYLCPLGAIFSITSRFRLFYIKRHPDKCGSCKLCTKKCKMGIPLYKYDKVNSGECINCFSCIENCQRNNIHANPTPAVASVVSIAAVSGLFYMGNYVSAAESNSDNVSQQTVAENAATGTYTNKNSNEISNENSNKNSNENSNINSNDNTNDNSNDNKNNKDNNTNSTINNNTNKSSNALSASKKTAVDTNSEKSSDVQPKNSASDGAIYKDGIYTGTGYGFRGNTKVSVTVTNGKISDITVVSYADNHQFFMRAENSVISEIIKKQDVNVDAVSGATFSSNGIMEAVANALGVKHTNVNINRGRFGRH